MRSTITGLIVCAGACGIVCLGSGRPAADRKALAASVVVVGPSEEVPALIRRSVAKDEVIDRLVAGRLRLDEAVAEFLSLNREWPPVPDHWYDSMAGRSIPERVARSIIWAVELQFGDDPRGDDVLCRLTVELGEIVAAADRPAVVVVYVN